MSNLTDEQIEQERKKIETPIEPLYVDSKADQRSRAWINFLLESSLLNDQAVIVLELTESVAYVGQGTLIAPFLTLEEARAAQKPDQNIVIAGYGTIGRAFGA